MSISSSVYETPPAFQRPAITGMSGGTGGAFMPPPPGASAGGEPGHYAPSHWREWYDTQAFQSQSQPHHAHSQQYHQVYSAQCRPQSLPYLPSSSHHSPYYSPHNSPYQPHSSQRAEYQAQHAQQPDPSSIPWTYGQYPPSPEYHGTAPMATTGFNTPNIPTSHVPPHSAPPEVTSWSQYSYQPRSHDYVFHQSPHSQQHFDRVRDQSHHRRPTYECHQSSNTLDSMPLTDESFRQPPLPFSGSANAPAPKKSALKRSYSQPPAVERPTTSGLRPHTPRIQHDDSTESGLSPGFNRTSWSNGPSPGMYPTMIPPVIPQIMYPYIPGYALWDEETWSLDNLSPRPRDWRVDYVPKQGILLHLPRIGKVRSDVEEYIDTVKRNLHPVLHHSLESEPLTFDLRYQIIEGHSLIISRNEIDLAQLATHPPAPILRLYHPKFPWYIDIHQSHPSGVTVFDVLAQMSLQMQTAIHNRHYHNDVLDSADRAALGKAYKERCSGRSGQSSKGIFQVDFLGEKYIFSGLARGKQGMWEIKSRRAGDHPMR